MISLEKIRNKSGLLLFVIGFALLAFILTDLLSSQNGGRSTTSLVVGDIGGEEIDYQVFEQRVQQAFENQTRSNPNISIDQVRNSVWNQLLRERILISEYDALGLKVSDTEVFDMVQGEDPYPSVKQSFVNPETGQFDRARLLQFLKEDINNDQTGQAKLQWLNFEDAILKERQNNKYNALISKGLNVSDWEAKMNKKYQSEIRNVSFVQIPLNTIPDSLINLSDSDLKDYLNENSSTYQQDASRELEYVVFNVSPSNDDREDAFRWMEDIKSDFSKTEDDERFVRKNSDVFNRVLYISESELVDNIKSLATSSKGTIIGPYSQSINVIRLAKLVDVADRPDSVQARHILLSGQSAQTKIDSIKSLVEKGQSFTQLAQDFSEDQGSKANGGDLGWFKEGTMVPEFNDACFSSNKGELKIVTSQFGVHLIELTGKSKSSKKYKLAFLDRQISYSNNTYQSIFAEAGKFAAENTNYQQFNESVLNQNLSKRVADGLLESTNTIPGLDNPRELVRWAYQAKIGQVSDVFEFGNKIVVATLTSIKNEGLIDLEDIRSTIEPIVRNNKKTEMLLNDLADLSSLDEVASNYGVEIENAEGLNFSSSQVPTLGNEPAFVGAAFALNEGQTSTAFSTSKAVCVVKVDKVISSPESGDYSSVKNSLLTNLQGRSTYQVFQALLENTEVIDNRAEFY